MRKQEITRENRKNRRKQEKMCKKKGENRRKQKKTRENRRKHGDKRRKQKIKGE